MGGGVDTPLQAMMNFQYMNRFFLFKYAIVVITTLNRKSGKSQCLTSNIWNFRYFKFSMFYTFTGIDFAFHIFIHMESILKNQTKFETIKVKTFRLTVGAR